MTNIVEREEKEREDFGRLHTSIASLNTDNKERDTGRRPHGELCPPLHRGGGTPLTTEAELSGGVAQLQTATNTTHETKLQPTHSFSMERKHIPEGGFDWQCRLKQRIKLCLFL